MKKCLPLFPAFLFFISLCFISQAQVQEWQSIQRFPNARSGAVSFVIGDTAYVGTGYTGSAYEKSFYKYTLDEGNWTSINEFPGVARENAVAFVADGKAYVGTGTDGVTQFKDFYEYDPSTGNWTAIADLPGEIRNQASSFSLNDKGYVGLGGNDTGSLNDFYEFDPTTGSWVTIEPLPADEARSRAVGFASSGKGYIASGSGSIQFTGMYSYDPASDSWTEEIFANSKLSSLQQNTVYTDGDGLVHILKSGFTKEQVIIDPSDNSLTTADAYFTDERNRGVAFYLNGAAYAGIGLVYDGFGNAVELNRFSKLVTIYPPKAPTNLRKSDDSGLRLFWDVNSNNADGFIVYLSEYDNENFEVADTTTYFNYKFDTLKQGIRNFVKVVAYNKAGAVESSEINYIPLYNSGKLVTPSLIDVYENQNDSAEIDMFLEFINYDEAGFMNVEMSTDGVNYESQFRHFVGKLDTVFASYAPFLETKAEKLYYRIKLTKLTEDGREDSDYSNIFTFNTEELKPIAPKIQFTIKQQTTSYWQGSKPYFIYKLSFSDYNHVDSISVIGIENDTIRFEDVLSNDFIRTTTFQLSESDTLQLYAINENVFGVDTTHVTVVAPTFHKPSFREFVQSNTKAIQFSIQSNVDNYDGYTIIERSEANNVFIPIDSIKPGDIYRTGGFSVPFIDITVEPNKDYSYRLVNRKGKLQSLYSNEIKKIKSTKTPAWKVFRENSLKHILDSMGNLGTTNVNYFDNKIFFLSAYSSNAYYFDLNIDKLVKMTDIPIIEEYDYWDTEFTELAFMNNKLYCFTPIIEKNSYNNTEKVDKAVFVYDVKEDSWSRSEVPDIRKVTYATPLSESVMLLVLEGFDLAKFSTNENKLEISDINVSATYLNVSEDSITVFEQNKYISKIDTGLQTQIRKGFSKDLLQKAYITEHKNKLLQVGNGRLSEIDFESASLLEYKENFPFSNQRSSFVFSYKDTLVHFDGRYRSSLRNFYYKNEEVPGTIVGLQMDSISYTSARATWIDSPDEKSYIIEITDEDGNTLETQNLPENSTSYLFEGLLPSTRYRIELTPLNGPLEGATDIRTFQSRNGRPSIPKNIELIQVSDDSLRLSWTIDEYSAKVDSIIVGNIIKTVQSTGDFQSIYLKGRNENDSIRQFIRAKNKWYISWDGFSNKILTRLYSPVITEVAYYEKEGKYQVVVNDTSNVETLFRIFRKTSGEDEFELFETIEGNKPNEFTFDDFIDDPSITYEYYVQSYLVENDSVINSSFPSNIASTENSILSNTPLLSEDLSIFPNPVNKQIYINSDLNIQLQQIEVLSLEGRLIKTFQPSKTVDVSGLEKGMYLLKIKAKSGEVIKRFIKE